MITVRQRVHNGERACRLRYLTRAHLPNHHRDVVLAYIWDSNKYAWHVMYKGRRFFNHSSAWYDVIGKQTNIVSKTILINGREKKKNVKMSHNFWNVFLNFKSVHASTGKLKPAAAGQWTRIRPVRSERKNVRYHTRVTPCCRTDK